METTILQLTPVQLSLAQHLANGSMPDLPVDQLEVGAAGRLVLPTSALPALSDRYQIPGTVVQVVTRNNVLMSILGQTIWLADCPTNGMRDGQSAPVAGCYTVSRTQTVQMGSTQRSILVLEPVNVDQLKEVAAYLKSDAAVSAGGATEVDNGAAASNDTGSANQAAAGGGAPRRAAAKENGYRKRSYSSIEQIFAAVPYPYQVETSDQLTGLRGEMRTSWLGENMPGALLDATVIFDYAEIGGSFRASRTFKELGTDHQVSVYATFKDDQLTKLSTFKKGEAMRIHGRILRMSDTDIRLADITFQRLINPPVDLGGGTIYLGTQPGQPISRQNRQQPLLQQRQQQEQQ
jgi:hypothetical protein